MDSRTVILEKEKGIAIITLNRPDALNALNAEMRAELVKILKALDADDEARVVVLKGAGRAFSAGDDLKLHPRTESKDRPKRDRHYTAILLALRHLGKPAIACVQGLAYGAGFEMVLACDIRIAAEGTRFAVPYAKLGATAGHYLLPRYVGLGRATEMHLTGEPIDAVEAHRLGIINEIAPLDELARATERWARRLAKGPTRSMGLAKKALNQAIMPDIEMGFEFSRFASLEAMRTEDLSEGIKAFAEKREPRFKGK